MSGNHIDHSVHKIWYDVFEIEVKVFIVPISFLNKCEYCVSLMISQP